MQRALGFAERGLLTTQPNPRVGCVLINAGAAVGEGWHERAGEPHAEVHALRQAGARAQGATAYVTLEPCAHFGRTGPCADALIAAGVARVVIAAADPFPAVDGAGIARLRAAGVVVEVGLLARQARELNPGFYSRVLRRRPWVRVKLGLSLDARSALGDGRSQWITGADARADVQRWRARSSAVMTGIDSVLADDPRLTVRLEPGVAYATPLRVVLDSAARMPVTARLLTESGPILWVTTPEATLRGELQPQVEHLSVPATNGRVNLPRVLLALAERGCNEVLVEAGPTLAGALVEAGLVDELLLYLAPKLLGDSARAAFKLSPLRELADAGEWQWQSVERVGSDLRMLLRAPAADQFLANLR